LQIDRAQPILWGFIVALQQCFSIFCREHMRLLHNIRLLHGAAINGYGMFGKFSSLVLSFGNLGEDGRE